MLIQLSIFIISICVSVYILKKVFNKNNIDEIDEWLKFHEALDKQYDEVKAAAKDTQELKDYLYDNLTEEVLNAPESENYLKPYTDKGLSTDAAILIILKSEEHLNPNRK